MNRRDFLKISAVASAASAVGVSTVVSATTSSVASAGFVYSKANPGRWAKKAAGHLPTIVSKKAGDAVEVTVTTPHEMKGYEHYIVKHIVLDEKYNVLSEKMFDPKKDKTPVSKHSLKYSGKIHVLSVCNKHDTWVIDAKV